LTVGLLTITTEYKTQKSPMKSQVAQSAPIFVYGTLMNLSVLQTLLGRSLSPIEETKVIRARLTGFVRHPVKEAFYPAMIQASLSSAPYTEVQGLLLPSFSQLEMALLDYFESDAYVRKMVQVFSSSSTHGEDVPLEAQAYLWREDLLSELDLSKEWSYENFCDSHLESYMRGTVRPCRTEMEKLGMTKE
jgi:gamma-glutamylcyclotransferase (GGCT)/AIG2-like uncharacterized protein YtfP